MHIFLYGPPGSGKTTLGQALAKSLDLPFLDLDEIIAAQAGRAIPEIFAQEGEAGFRCRELAALKEAAGGPPAVVALGGGALLNPQARSAAEAAGLVVCLSADYPTLLARLREESGGRPLLNGDPQERLKRLLAEREAHYQSFPTRLETSQTPMPELVWQAQMLSGAFRVRGMKHEYDVRVDPGGLDRLGDHLRLRDLKGPIGLVADSNTGPAYLDRAVRSLLGAGYGVAAFQMQAGEAYKTMDTVMSVWDFFLQSGIERGSTVVALGGGVVGDLAGFAASAFLRGVPWVNLPTSLLAMVDSSLGGKTGVDLPQAKNMVGAFYPPSLVLTDPGLLATLPERELRGGLAEVVKHGVIGDPALFALCEQGWAAVLEQLEQVVRQGMAVKLKVIEQDPFEKGLRQALNLGHTIGHGVELASDYRLSHGEAVAIGTAAEARLAERMGLAEAGLAQRIAAVFSGLGLPVDVPAGLSTERILGAMRLDKKRAAGQVRFALPVRVGEVRTGVVVDDWSILMDLL